MKKIILQVEIKDIESWDVNWDNEKEKKAELISLSMDVANAICDCGLSMSDISVEAKLEND